MDASLNIERTRRPVTSRTAALTPAARSSSSSTSTPRDAGLGRWGGERGRGAAHRHRRDRAVALQARDADEAIVITDDDGSPGGIEHERVRDHEPAHRPQCGEPVTVTAVR